MNIAICDDNETDIKYIGKIIKKEFAAHNINCELSLHTDAKSLLDVNQSQPFDVIFLDLDMPRLNGMDAASQLNKSNSAAEIIFVTNHDELVYKAYKFKALGFIRKKYLETEIEEILETLIETINSRQQYITFSDSVNEFKCLINDIMYMQSDDHYIDVITPNAIEASLNVDSPQITVSIRNEKNYLCILIRNRIESSVLEENGQLHTTKKDKSKHGLGVYSISQIVDKYDGMKTYYEKNGYFVADIWLKKKGYMLEERIKNAVNYQTRQN